MKFYTLFQATLCAALLCSAANADISLVVDFGDGASPTDSAAEVESLAAFTAIDANLDPLTAVNFINGDAAGNGSGTISGVGGAADLNVTLGNGFLASGGPFAGEAVLNDYIFGNGTDPQAIVTGLEEIQVGSLVTLTGFSHGDQDAQVANLLFDVTEGGISTVTDSGVLSAADGAFFSFSFVTTDVVDSISITADNTGEGNQFAAINGFSLSAIAPEVVPEPASGLLLGMGLIGCLGLRRRTR